MFGGKIRGAYNFFILRTILDTIGTEKFPNYSRILKVARDLKDQWYGWEGFCEFLNEVEKVTTEEDLRAIGVKIMMGVKEGFISAGLTIVDAVLRDYDPLLKKNTKQMPPTELPKTIHYEPGFVIIEISASRPKALIEGYLMGIVQIFGRQLISLKSEPVSRGDFSGFKYELHWQ